jgi:coatomer protein complex subunit gamma
MVYRSLKAYMAHPLAASESDPLTFNNLPVIEDAYVPASLPAVRASAGATKKKADTPETDAGGAKDVVDPSSAVYKVPQLLALGRASHSSKEVALTESEMEYVVTCVKHVFASHVVLDFTVLNTLNDQRLTDVHVDVEMYDAGDYEVDTVISAPVAKYGEHTHCFVSLKTPAVPAPVNMQCELKFKVVQVDPNTGQVEGDDAGDEEEYRLEDLEIGTSLFMKPTFESDFRKGWEDKGSANPEGEVLMKFALQYKTLEEAVNAILDMLNMMAVDKTRVVTAPAGPKRTHALHLCGTIGGVQVLARAQLQTDESANPNQVVLKLAVRSADKAVSQLVADCIN